MVHEKRIRALTDYKYNKGPVIYWMSRDQRAHDNWALLYAQQRAKEHNVSLVVLFCLRGTFAHATDRLVSFMLEGLQEVEETLKKKDIPFYFLLGDPEEKIPEFIRTHTCGMLISDFLPLRYNQAWKETIVPKITIPFFEVDTHNIVPCWIASPKQEFGAYTIRNKIHNALLTFQTEFTVLQNQTVAWDEGVTLTDWKKIYSQIEIDHSVPKVAWIVPGEKAADQALSNFLENNLHNYATERNDPTKDAQSNLSPYIHFGHIATQRIALEVEKIEGLNEAKKAFLEELIVRKELSDNFCFYNANYDNPDGFPNWAKETLDTHTNDVREYLYSLEDLEQGKTHDELWNAAQKQMVHRGKMHGYLRMYWAKKIMEWTNNAKEAMEYATYLNDRYFLDGRDPNGYTGIAWSMGGVHDRAWFERPIFGKIRYMNYNGAKSKFDIKAYIKKVEYESIQK